MSNERTFGTAAPPPFSTDRHGLEVLDRSACLRLLGNAHVGRVGFSSGALPVVLPVNFVLLGDSILFRSEDGVKTRAARDSVVACFEVDGFDGLVHNGWSVLATGRLREVDDPEERRRAERLPLASWMSNGMDHYIELGIELLSGRRLRDRAEGNAREG